MPHMVRRASSPYLAWPARAVYEAVILPSDRLRSHSSVRDSDISGLPKFLSLHYDYDIFCCIMYIRELGSCSELTDVGS